MTAVMAILVAKWSCFAVLLPVAADPFLQKQQTLSLLQDLEFTLGTGVLEHRAKSVEARLLPMYTALPKDSQGRVTSEAARYAIKTITTAKHGWKLAGFDSDMAYVSGENTSTTNSKALLSRGYLPEHIDRMFTQRCARGLNFDDLTAFASVVEYFFVKGQMDLLDFVHEFLQLETELSEKELMKLLSMTMIGFLDGATNDPQNIQQAESLYKANYEKVYPGWLDIELMLSDVREDFSFQELHTRNPFTNREATLGVAQQVLELFFNGFVHEIMQPDCEGIKNDLMRFELNGTGRVLLADFYRAGLDAKYFYVETEAYQRASGSLDETDFILGPKVLISNYVSHSCLIQTKKHKSCCLDECSGLMNMLTHELRDSTGSPHQISSLVSQFSTATVTGPRDLPPLLMRRLEEISSAHSGEVPIYGRLFAQWLHQAFPRECKYPFVSGSITQLDPEEWSQQTGLSWRVDDTDMDTHPALLQAISNVEKKYGRPHDSQNTHGQEVDLQWTYDEELFLGDEAGTGIFAWSSWYSAPPCAIIASVVSWLGISSRSSVSSSFASKKQAWNV